MIFAGLILFLVCAAFLPWWGFALAGAVLGAFPKNSKVKDQCLWALSAGVANVVLAIYADGRHFGLISQRMGGLFSLPGPHWIFAVMFALAFIQVFLWLRAGMILRVLYNKFTK